MRRYVILAGGAALALALLTGCSGQSGSSSNGSVPTTDELVGTWVVDETFDVETQPYLTIEDGGGWTASDGCNTVTGTWELASDGSLTTTAGPSTLIYCDGKPLPTLMANAKSVALDGETLELKDASGSVAVALIPGSSPTPTPTPAG